MPSSFIEQRIQSQLRQYDEANGRRKRRDDAIAKAKAVLLTYGISDAEDLSRAHGELAHALTGLLTEMEGGA